MRLIYNVKTGIYKKSFTPSLRRLLPLYEKAAPLNRDGFFVILPYKKVFRFLIEDTFRNLRFPKT